MYVGNEANMPTGCSKSVYTADQIVFNNQTTTVACTAAHLCACGTECTADSDCDVNKFCEDNECKPLSFIDPGSVGESDGSDGSVEMPGTIPPVIPEEDEDNCGTKNDWNIALVSGTCESCNYEPVAQMFCMYAYGVENDILRSPESINTDNLPNGCIYVPETNYFAFNTGSDVECGEDINGEQVKCYCS